ncbi:hypothetical protein SY27_09560 [Flavobacterium sp. 316]|uniref:hypothetical protein n=1 Tax=Flavobacterium sp. 316 TaxID=1603293 RepID=UPI0005E58E0E|nr:hypothetical protein [Flavobacterium sp. 316]KIX21012.1 hypothetical protein SY27_09560 [Flavobacterium sp. 316]
MKKSILKLKGSQELTKKEQKSINGGIRIPIPGDPIEEPKSCGGDGSFIYVNGVKTCCYIPYNNTYFC